MGDWVRIVGWSVVSALKSQRDLTLENLALRHQLMVLQRQSGRPRLKDRDRLVWVCLRRLWHGWHRALVVVQPATVVKWHRDGFQAYWRWRSRSTGGRPRIDREVRELIHDMWRSNPTWGKPRIQAELRKIGIEVSDSTVWRFSFPQDVGGSCTAKVPTERRRHPCARAVWLCVAAMEEEKAPDHVSGFLVAHTGRIQGHPTLGVPAAEDGWGDPFSSFSLGWCVLERGQ